MDELELAMRQFQGEGLTHIWESTLVKDHRMELKTRPFMVNKPFNAA